jgi:hypothetical protein
MLRPPVRSRRVPDRLASRARRLLADERGDAMQWVMGLAVAALLILALLTFGKDLVKKIQEFTTKTDEAATELEGGGGG